MPITLVQAQDSPKDKKVPEVKLEIDPNKPAPVIPTEAELEAQKEEFQEGMFPSKPADKKPKEPVKIEEKPIDAPKEPLVEEKKPEKPKKKTKPAQVQPEPIEPDLDDLASRVSDRIKSQEPDPEPEPQDDFTDEDRTVLEAAEKLQTSGRYKGKNLVQETKEFWKRETDYIAKWEAEHTGESFDENDPAHAPFYKRNYPSYTDADLDSAKQAVSREKLKKEVMEEVRKETEPERRQARAEQAMRKHAPLIQQSVVDSVAQMVSGASDEFKKLMTGEDGSLSLSQEVIAKLEEVDPVALQLIDREAHILRVKVAELEKLDRLGEFINPDPSLRIKTPAGYVMPHAEIMEAGTELEEKIGRLSPAQRLHDGKTFVTRAELRDKADSIIKSRIPDAQKRVALDALEKRHWFINSEDIRAKFVHDSTEKMKPIIAASQKHVARFKTNSAKTGENGNSSEASKTQSSKPSSPAPSVSSSSDSVDTKLNGRDAQAAESKEFADSMWS